MKRMPDVVPQGNWSQVSEPVGECFASALFISKELAMQTVKTAGGHWALKEMHSWVLDPLKLKLYVTRDKNMLCGKSKAL